MSDRSRADDEGQPSRAARLATGIASIVLLVAFLVTCVVLDLRRGSQPALVEARVLPATKIGSAPATVVEVENAGDITAEGVLVRIEGSGGPDADPVEQVVDFLAPGETEEFTLPLEGGAAPADVTATVTSWVDAG